MWKNKVIRKYLIGKNIRKLMGDLKYLRIRKCLALQRKVAALTYLKKSIFPVMAIMGNNSKCLRIEDLIKYFVTKK